MFNLVCMATQAQILRKSRSIRITSIKPKNTDEYKNFELIDNEIMIYDANKV
jgi:hypothetical protein